MLLVVKGHLNLAPSRRVVLRLTSQVAAAVGTPRMA